MQLSMPFIVDPDAVLPATGKDQNKPESNIPSAVSDACERAALNAQDACHGFGLVRLWIFNECRRGSSNPLLLMHWVTI